MTAKPAHPWQYFLLVYLMSAPFWLIAGSISRGGLPDNLPLTDIGAAFTPTIAALILRYREGGGVAVRQLLARAHDYHRINARRWLAFAILLFPALYLLTWLAMRAIGLPVPLPAAPTSALLLAVAVFYFAAIVEELGYTAYATDALQQRYNPLATALIIGIPWALWHLRSMIQIGQSPALILWGLAGTVAVRVIYVWLYNRVGRAVAILILCHTIANTARTAYPGGRAAYELGDGAISYGIIIAAALLILATNWRDMTSHPGASA